MKALVHSLTGKYIAFFTTGISDEQVETYVLSQLFFDEPGSIVHLLGLNEAHSCMTGIRVNGSEHFITISGDEDYVELQIVDVVPVM